MNGLPDKPARVWHTFVLTSASLLVMIMASWYANQQLTLLNDLSQQRGQTWQGRLHIVQVLSQLKDVETGARGYALTGEADYLQPYLAARSALPPLTGQLRRELGADLPEGQSWAGLDALIGQRIELAQRLVELRQRFGVSTHTQDAELLMAGKQTMDRLRTQFQAIDAHQQQRIARLNEAVSHAREQAYFWVKSADLLALLLLAVASYLRLRATRARFRLETLLRESHAKLEERVAKRTAELSAARERVASFAREQDRAVTAEQRRLSREVHDQIGQAFTAIKLMLTATPQAAHAEAEKQLLLNVLESGIAATRRITAALRPPLLDDLGLEAALQHYADTQGVSGLRHEIQLADPQRLDAEQTLTLFRIVQEAFSNTRQHAHASLIAIRGQAQDHAYVLRISDDGEGLTPAPTRPGALGLVGMRERAELLGGSLTIDSPPGAGVTVTVHLPLKETADGLPAA